MKASLRIGGQMISYHIIIMVVNLLFVLPSMGGVLWMQIAVSLLLMVGYAAMLYADGCTRGERAATLLVQLDRQRSEGKPVARDQEALSFQKATAWKGYLIGVLPFALLAIVNIAMEPLYPPYVAPTEEDKAQLEALQQSVQQTGMPELADEGTGEVAALEDAAQPSEPTQPTEPDAATQPDESVRINPFNVAARIAFTPYQFLYTPLQDRAVLLNWLFLAFALMVPLAEPIGYLQGPKLRKKKLTVIEQGKKRKMRNLKVNKKPRQPRKPKMEV